MIHTRLSRLPDETLMQHAYVEQHDLVTTDMERELLARLEAQADRLAHLGPPRPL